MLIAWESNFCMLVECTALSYSCPLDLENPQSLHHVLYDRKRSIVRATDPLMPKLEQVVKHVLGLSLDPLATYKKFKQTFGTPLAKNQLNK